MRTVADADVLQQLAERLHRLSPDSERRWGTLTVHEMLCHLGDTSAGVLGTRKKPAGPTNSRPLVRYVGLWLPFPWRGQRTGRWNDPRGDGTRPTDFSSDRARALEGIEAIAVAGSESLASGHGIFGRMSVPDWQRYTFRHTDYHLRQFGV